jgi:adenylate kinase family enzyme
VIELVRENVEKNPHSIIVDYPNTYEQAIALCKAIGNVEPHDMLATNKLTKKIKEFERLVKGTSSRVVERRVRECGIDFVWWIDVTAENSLDRMLGRRWIGET